MASVSDIVTLIEGDLSHKNIRQLTQILQAVFCLGGRVTMLGISRMAAIPYRSLSRFYDTTLDWFLIRFRLFESAFFDDCGAYILVGDETVEGKAGRKTFGINQHYCSTYGKAIPSISMFALSVVNVSSKHSYPLCVEQLIETEEDRIRKERVKEQRIAGKGGKRGRKAGTKNTVKPESDYPLLRAVKSCLASLKGKIEPTSEKKHLSLRYWALDGYFGHQAYVDLAEANGLFLISKLKRTADLYFPAKASTEPKRRGRPRLYGDKIDLGKHYPEHDVTTLVKNKLHDTKKLHNTKKPYALVQQFKARCRTIKGRLLNVVVLYPNGASALENRVVLFSTDLTLTAAEIILYYSCRTQIEINFRECKQYFGLSDFKNTKQERVTFSINLAFTLCGISLILRKGYQKAFNLPFVSTEDVRTMEKASKMAEIIISASSKPDTNIFNLDKIREIAKYEAINL